MNRYTATGWLTRDPELRKLGESDRDVCELRVAIDNGKDRDATFLDVSTFDAAARACAKYLAKGRPVAVDGRLIYHEWTATDGSKRSKHSVIGRVEFLGSRNAAAPSTERTPASVVDSNGDEIPF